MNRAMKDSGIPWIGEIPEGWEVSRHKNIMFKKKDIQEHGEIRIQKNKQRSGDLKISETHKKTEHKTERIQPR